MLTHTKCLIIEPSQPPINIKAIAISPHAINITWKLPPPETFNGPLRWIRIVARERMDTIAINIIKVPYNLTSYTYIGLKAYKKYLISLQVENSVDHSDRSPSIAVKTLPEGRRMIEKYF